MKKPKKSKMGKRNRIKVSAYPVYEYQNLFYAITYCSKNIQELTKMSFKDSLHFKMWLFVSIPLSGPFTAEDIFDYWPYLEESDVSSSFSNPEELKQCILDDAITESEYIKIGRIIVKKLYETNICQEWKLSLLLRHDYFQNYFGRLALISYYLDGNYGQGRLKREEFEIYKDRNNLVSTFGSLWIRMERNKNLSVIRMNKSFYQYSGCSPEWHERGKKLLRQETGNPVLWWEHEGAVT